MDKISYYVLFLLICIGVGVYVMRRNFTSFYRTVFGIPMPSYVISAAISVLIGFFLWLIVLILLAQFKH